MRYCWFGQFAQTFVKDLKLVEDPMLTAVASRSIAKSKEFGSEYNSKYVFGSYKELF